MHEWQRHSELEGVDTERWRFVARQPIFDRSISTFGYELLARSGWRNVFSGELESGSQSVLDIASAYGLQSLVGDAIPFVNCTRQVLLGDALGMLPTSAVLELLETTEVDSELVEACQRWKKAGFRLALDDYEGDEKWEPLLALADFIKIDVRLSDPMRRTLLLKRFLPTGKLMIAEKVETYQEFRTLFQEGFHLFQGYFFTRPIITARPSTPSLICALQLVSLLRQPELPLRETLQVIHQESSVAIRLLRAANSSRCSRGDAINDLRSAYLHVGESLFRALALSVLGNTLCGEQPLEFHRAILVRSRFCELSASMVGAHDGEMFVFGMLSILKDPLHIDLAELTNARVVKREFADALSGVPTAPLSSLLECAAALSTASWSRLNSAANHLGAPAESLALCFREAQQWADQLLRAAAST